MGVLRGASLPLDTSHVVAHTDILVLSIRRSLEDLVRVLPGTVRLAYIPTLRILVSVTLRSSNGDIQS